MWSMYERAASSGDMLLPPLSVEPSGSLKASRCVDEEGRLDSWREICSEDASSRP